MRRRDGRNKKKKKVKKMAKGNGRGRITKRDETETKMEEGGK